MVFISIKVLSRCLNVQLKIHVLLLLKSLLVFALRKLQFPNMELHCTAQSIVHSVISFASITISIHLFMNMWSFFNIKFLIVCTWLQYGIICEYVKVRKNIETKIGRKVFENGNSLMQDWEHFFFFFNNLQDSGTQC